MSVWYEETLFRVKLSTQNEERGKGWGRQSVRASILYYYTPLYEKGIKKIDNKPMETTYTILIDKTNTFSTILPILS